jgi:hypothetical protein
MGNWVYIENDKIIEVFESLPENWKNISNFSASENDKEFLKSLGWHPIEHGYIDYNSKTQRIIKDKLMFSNGKVTQSYIIENINSSEYYDNFMSKLREKRNRLLTESDFMCLYDLIISREEQYLMDVKEYRQQLRDLPEKFSDSGIYYDIFSVVYPDKPILNKYKLIN